MTIFAYSDAYIADGTAYNADFSTVLPEGAEGEQLSLDALKYIENTDVAVVNGKTLRGRNYEHVLSRDKTIDIIISADELIVADNYEFMASFWEALHKYIVIDDEYKLITTGGGALPVEYISENKYLREVKLSVRLAYGE